MSNIHTLSDVHGDDEEARRNEPVPNPWTNPDDNRRIASTGAGRGFEKSIFAEFF